VFFPFRIVPPTDESTRVVARVDESELDPIELRGREIFEIIVASGRAKNALVRSGHLSSL
jgi:hypothetical protein